MKLEPEPWLESVIIGAVQPNRGRTRRAASGGTNACGRFNAGRRRGEGIRWKNARIPFHPSPTANLAGRLKDVLSAHGNGAYSSAIRGDEEPACSGFLDRPR